MPISDAKLELLNCLMQQFSNLSHSNITYGPRHPSLAQTLWASEALLGIDEYLLGCDREPCLEYRLFLEWFGAAKIWNRDASRETRYLMYIWGPQLVDDGISFDDVALDFDDYIVFACLKQQALRIDYGIDRKNGRIVRAVHQAQPRETSNYETPPIQSLNMTFLEWLEAYVADSAQAVFKR